MTGIVWHKRFQDNFKILISLIICVNLTHFFHNLVLERCYVAMLTILFSYKLEFCISIRK